MSTASDPVESAPAAFGGPRPTIDRIAVVVPARNEADRLDECLRAVLIAVDAVRRHRPAASVTVVLVLDSCTDGSADIAARHPGVVVERREVANVGAARAAAVSSALGEIGDDRSGRPASTWIATTDADSIVPSTWLLDQLELADSGADAVLGSVVPLRAELTVAQQLEWDRRHPHGAAIGNIHGANLGVRAAAYLEAGGFAALTVHEDVGLVAALRRTGAVVVASEATPVTTSGRSEGRAPGGYAEYLRSLVPAAS